MAAVSAVPGANKLATLNGGYGTRGQSEMQFEYRGSVEDAKPVKEFIEARLRDAASRTIDAAFDLAFDDGLPLNGDAAEKLTEWLARFATGAAYVTAAAAPKA